jgi:hypothetical protein
VLTKNFGKAWLRGDRPSLKLVDILWTSDAVTAAGFIRSPESGGRARRFGFKQTSGARRITAPRLSLALQVLFHPQADPQRVRPVDFVVC